MAFEFSDTIGGICRSYDAATRTGIIRDFNGEDVKVKMSDNVYARLLRNLDEPYRDCTGQIAKLFK